MQWNALYCPFVPNGPAICGDLALYCGEWNRSFGRIFSLAELLTEQTSEPCCKNADDHGAESI